MWLFNVRHQTARQKFRGLSVEPQHGEDVLGAPLCSIDLQP